MKWEGGFAYHGVLFAVLGTALALASGARLLSNELRRDKEADLLACGDEIKRAIEKFHQRNTAGSNTYPLRLEHLLRDPQQAGIQRYLRKICRDPMQEQDSPDRKSAPDWALVLDAKGQVIGVHSKSMREPLKRGGFAQAYEAFRRARHYADWQFIAAGAVPAPQLGATLGAGNFIPAPMLGDPLAEPATPTPTPPPTPAPTPAQGTTAQERLLLNRAAAKEPTPTEAPAPAAPPAPAPSTDAPAPLPPTVAPAPPAASSAPQGAAPAAPAANTTPAAPAATSTASPAGAAPAAPKAEPATGDGIQPFVIRAPSNF